MSPTLADLLHEPQRMAEVPPEALPPLMAQCAALQSALAARLAAVKPDTPPQPTQEPERLLTVPQVAELLGVHPSCVYEVARSGKLPTVRVGKYVRIAPSALREWLAQHKKGLDKGMCVTHSYTDERFRGPAHSEATWAYASRVGSAGRRHRQQRGPVGAGRVRYTGIGGPAHPAAGRPRQSQGNAAT